MIENTTVKIENVAIYNLQGQLLFQNKYENSTKIELDFSAYAKGIYMVNINDTATLKIAKH